MRIVYNNMSIERADLQQTLDAIHEEIDFLKRKLREGELSEEEKHNIREDMRLFKRHVNSTRKRLRELSVVSPTPSSPVRQRRRSSSRGGRKTRRVAGKKR